MTTTDFTGKLKFNEFDHAGDRTFSTYFRQPSLLPVEPNRRVTIVPHLTKPVSFSPTLKPPIRGDVVILVLSERKQLILNLPSLITPICALDPSREGWDDEIKRTQCRFIIPSLPPSYSLMMGLNDSRGNASRGLPFGTFEICFSSRVLPPVGSVLYADVYDNDNMKEIVVFVSPPRTQKGAIVLATLIEHLTGSRCLFYTSCPLPL